MSERYKLKGRKPVPCEDLIEWAEWFGTADRRVAQDFVGKVNVSTVFLGIDHAFGGKRPLLFETMIFGGEHDDFQARYSTWEEAEEGHKKALAMVTGE